MQFYTICFLLLLVPVFLLADQALQPKQKIVIMLGAPASGKGTQAVQIAKDLSLPHISTGDLFRENIGQNTPLGQKAKSYIDQGKLVPDEIVLDMLFDRVAKPDAAKGYILDGFPRTLVQAKALEAHLPKKAQVIVLNLDVSDETITKRALGRKRSDDTLEVIQERLKNYHAQTAPLVEYYTAQGILSRVNGEQTPELVFQDLMKAIQK